MKGPGREGEQRPRILFGEKASLAYSNAIEEAQLLGYHTIGSESLLLGFLRPVPQYPSNHSSLLPAGELLLKFGVTLGKVRSAAVFVNGRGHSSNPEPINSATPRVKKAIAFAQEEARQEGVVEIDDLHLLGGLLSEGQGLACGVLESLGVSLDKLDQSRKDYRNEQRRIQGLVEQNLRERVPEDVRELLRLLQHPDIDQTTKKEMLRRVKAVNEIVKNRLNKGHIPEHN